MQPRLNSQDFPNDHKEKPNFPKCVCVCVTVTMEAYLDDRDLVELMGDHIRNFLQRIFVVAKYSLYVLLFGIGLSADITVYSKNIYATYLKSGRRREGEVVKNDNLGHHICKEIRPI